MNENDVEQLALECLQALGYDYAHGPTIDPDGVLIGVVEYGDEATPVRFTRFMNQLHTARLEGAYPILAFVACVIGAVLPLTGALIWFPRWRRTRGRARSELPE